MRALPPAAGRQASLKPQYCLVMRHGSQSLGRAVSRLVLVPVRKQGPFWNLAKCAFAMPVRHPQEGEDKDEAEAEAWKYFREVTAQPDVHMTRYSPLLAILRLVTCQVPAFPRS